MGSCRRISSANTNYRLISNTPDTLKMHRSNLDHMASLLALQDTITTTTSHASYVEKLGTIDHMVI